MPRSTLSSRFALLLLAFASCIRFFSSLALTCVMPRRCYCCCRCRCRVLNKREREREQASEREKAYTLEPCLCDANKIVIKSCDLNGWHASISAGNHSSERAVCAQADRCECMVWRAHMYVPSWIWMLDESRGIILFSGNQISANGQRLTMVIPRNNKRSTFHFVVVIKLFDRPQRYCLYIQWMDTATLILLLSGPGS